MLVPAATISGNLLLYCVTISSPVGLHNGINRDKLSLSSRQKGEQLRGLTADPNIDLECARAGCSLSPTHAFSASTRDRYQPQAKPAPL
ncbi:hypothetical protein FJTKL_02106 [Diaporthe vaccinii]|uniref:Secreted protein n=1 Tax=Diaporthe vaccinii TaxID=105482 RepID=A0ABR4DYZ1_9PEZI